jgi:transposase-like protein
VDIQPVSGLAANAAIVAAPGSATPGASISELAQQHGVSRESLVQFVQSKIQQTREANGEPPLDQSALDDLVDHALDHNRGRGTGADGSASDEPTSAGYTATAQRAAARAGASRAISILA